MKPSRKILLSIAAAASIGSLAFAVDSTAPSNPAASGPPPEARHRIERMMKFAVHRLDLTEEQTAALKEVLRLHQQELQPLRQRSRTERETLRAIVAAPALDDAALEDQATRIAATTKELAIASAHLRADMRAILTPEQLEKLAKLRGHATQRRHRTREAFGQWLAEP